MTGQPRVEDLWTSSRGTTLRLRAYDAEADAPLAVVVLHGLATGVDVLRGAVPGLDPFARLAAEGVHVLGLDWPGHGRSGGRRGHLPYRLAMEAAATAVEVARDRWDRPVTLLGTALGGVLAFYAALEDDRVTAVVCHDVLDLRDVRPVLRRVRQRVALPFVGWLHARLDSAEPTAVPGGRPAAGLVRGMGIPASVVVAWTDLAEDPALVRALRRHPQSVRRYTLSGLSSLLLSPGDKPNIAAQRVPTMIAVGTDDHVLPETPARHFASRLSCENEVWVLPGAGHQLLLEHSRAFLPAAAGFLRRHVAG